MIVVGQVLGSLLLLSTCALPPPLWLNRSLLLPGHWMFGHAPPVTWGNNRASIELWVNLIESHHQNTQSSCQCLLILPLLKAHLPLQKETVISDQVDNYWQGTECTSRSCLSGGWFWFWSARWRLSHNSGIMSSLILSPFLRVSILYVDSHCPPTSHGTQASPCSRPSVSSIFSQWSPCFPCLELFESHAPSPCALQQWCFTLSSASPTESRLGAPPCCFQQILWASSIKTWIPLRSGFPVQWERLPNPFKGWPPGPLPLPSCQSAGVMVTSATSSVTLLTLFPWLYPGGYQSR